MFLAPFMLVAVFSKVAGTAEGSRFPLLFGTVGLCVWLLGFALTASAWLHCHGCITSCVWPTLVDFGMKKQEKHKKVMKRRERGQGQGGTTKETKNKRTMQI